MPIYLLATDSVGNQTLKTDFVLYVDPDGDNPKADISYPTNDLILGGTIRVNGTAEDNESVAEVHLQIDTDGDDDFDETDRDYLKSYYSIKNATSSDDWYIVVDGKVNWNISINEKGEFNPPKNTEDTEKTSSGINIRVRAKDADSNESKIGLWSQPPVKITIDDSNPKIGSHAPLRLVQYNDNDDYTSGEKASMQYIPDMWIKGKWWLVGSVQDENGINEIVIENTTESTISTINTEETRIESDENHTDYIFYIPLDTTVMSEDKNSFSFGLHAKDNSEPKGKQTQTISIKYDNTAPELAENLEYSGSDNEKAITQSNNAVEIASSVTESGSGFQRLAIYFKRTGKDGERIYNPVINKGEDGNGNRINITNDGVKIIDGLPRLTVTVDDRDSPGTITHDLLKDNPNIRKGGLVRIGGVERLITDVDPNGTVTFTPAVDTSYTTAEFAYALVVDNFKVENATAWDDSGNPTTISNTDGDDVIESVAKTGATYNWTLAINSKNIPDGPISICYVAYDEAGNCSSLKEISTKVENNPPMIAKVWLGTDLDGNGTISRIDEVNSDEVNYSEEVEYRTDAKKSNSVSVNTTADGETLFTAKGKTTIRPEIVGGNGNLYYTVDTVDKVDKELKILRGKVGNVEGDGSILLEVNGETLAGAEDGDKREFSFTIWDSTEECTLGVDTLDASLSVTMAVDVVDDIKPTVQISPLSWESEDKNSLYDNSRNNGHIELSEELPGVFKETSGVMDRDDKVSGKITFTGTAYDNVCLGSLVFTFDKFSDTIKFDNSDNSDWSSVEKMDSDGYVFTAETDSLDQGGHKVNWTLSIDTAKIENVAATDVNLTVSATDKGSNSSSTVESEDKTNVPSYKVDVVPYIAGIVRSGAEKTLETTNRSRFGANPVIEGETITVYGFNLTEGTVKVGTQDVKTGITDNDDTDTFVSFEMTVPAQSGALSVIVKSVESLNNSNKNDSHGKAEAGENIVAREQYYNREVNVDNSLSLDYTDDRYLYVWNLGNYFKGTDGGVELSNPIMTADASGNLYASWVAQSNSNVMFSYGLKQNTSAIFRCYDQPATSTSISYDKAGTAGIGVTFIPEHQGSGGTFSPHAISSSAMIGGIGAINLNSDFLTAKKSLSGQKLTIEKNPRNTMDDTNNSPYFNLANYDMSRRMGAYEKPQTVRYGNNIHSIWYDNVNESLKYSIVDTSDSTIEKFDKNSGAIVGWVVLDGGYTGQDRLHEITAYGTKEIIKEIKEDGTEVEKEVDKQEDVNNQINSRQSIHSTLVRADVNDKNRTLLNTATYNSNIFLRGDDFTVNSQKNGITITSNNSGITPKKGDTIALLQNTAGDYAITLKEITNEPTGTTTDITWDGSISHDIHTVTIYCGDMNVVSTTPATTNYTTFKSGATDVSTSAGLSADIDVTKDGKPIVAYYDAANSKLKVVAAKNVNPDLASEWTRYDTGKTCSGEVNLAVDENDGIHITYLNTNGALCYLYAASANKLANATEEIIDTNGLLSYGSLSVIERDSEIVPCITYLNRANIDDCIKYAEKNSNGWDYQIIPSLGLGHHAVAENQISLEGYKENWKNTEETDVLTNGGAKSATPATVDVVIAFKSKRFETAYLKKE